MLALKSKIGRTYIFTSTLISLGIVFLILVSLFTESFEAITANGTEFFSTNWNPEDGKFGVLPMLYGTLASTLIALTIAVPLGLLTAIFLSEFLPKKFRIVFKSFIELLAGIPSIIYGLIGIAFLSIWIQNLFDLQSGRTILTAGILLGVMLLPTIITLVDDAFNAIPNHYRESSRGLGLYPYEIIQLTLLPMCKRDIIGAILLALGRALGETMAVMLVIGSIDKIPETVFNFLSPGQTITSKLGREIAETSFGSLHFSALILMGLILLVIVISVTLIAQLSFSNTDRIYE